MSRTTCNQPNCDKPVRSLGLCPAHYSRLRRGDALVGMPVRENIPECSIAECGRPLYAAGLCNTHYARQCRGVPIDAPIQTRQTNHDKTCSVASCDRPTQSLGLCSGHYQRQARGKPLDAPWRTPQGRHLSSDGYMLVSAVVDGRQVRRGEHRVVMEQIVGRPLKRSETVHHRNGNRADNRPTNLELWASQHHPGQRVTDLLAWARTILNEYAPIEDRLT